MRRLIVLTVDTNPDRGPAMCGAFRSVDADSYLYDGIRLASAEDLMMNVSPPTTVWNLVLLHTNNEELWTKFFSATGATVPVQREMESGRSPLV